MCRNVYLRKWEFLITHLPEVTALLPICWSLKTYQRTWHPSNLPHAFERVCLWSWRSFRKEYSAQQSPLGGFIGIMIHFKYHFLLEASFCSSIRVRPLLCTTGLCDMTVPCTVLIERVEFEDGPFAPNSTLLCPALLPWNFFYWILEQLSMILDLLGSS